MLGAADVGVLLRFAHVVPTDVPAADAHLEALVFLRMHLGVAQLLRNSSFPSQFAAVTAPNSASVTSPLS